jgi:hypothetical protein
MYHVILWCIILGSPKSIDFSGRNGCALSSTCTAKKQKPETPTYFVPCTACRSLSVNLRATVSRHYCAFICPLYFGLPTVAFLWRFSLCRYKLIGFPVSIGRAPEWVALVPFQLEARKFKLLELLPLVFGANFAQHLPMSKPPLCSGLRPTRLAGALIGWHTGPGWVSSPRTGADAAF